MPRSDYRATLAKRRADVAAMFDGVAQRYDLMNDVMTAGQMRQWRKAVIDAVDPKPGQRILDLAAGTGTSSRPFADAGAMVVPTDLSLGMLKVGKERQPDLHFVAGDALALPFADNSFDAVTISYGLRNVERTLDALVEMRRVTTPGGRLVIAEVSTPTNRLFSTLYKDHLLGILPMLGKAASSNPSAYVYLAESMQTWPDQQTLADLIAEAGWRYVQWRNLLGGMVAIHRGIA